MIDQIDAQTWLDKIYMDNLPPVSTKATVALSKRSGIQNVQLDPVEPGERMVVNDRFQEDARTFEGRGYVYGEMRIPAKMTETDIIP